MHLEAAQGWLELGNHEEANEELELIDAPLRSHPDVLEVRWGIYAKVKDWEACLHIAKAMVKLDPVHGLAGCAYISLIRFSSSRFTR